MRLLPRNKHKLLLYLLMFYTSILIPTISFSQQDELKLTVTGGSVQLLVTSLSQYSSGIELTSWTKVRIFVDDPTAFDGWKLYIWSNEENIMPDNNENAPLSLSYLELTPVSVTQTNTTAVTNPSFALTNTETVFMEGIGNNKAEVNFWITYKFGKTVSLINIPWGFYYTQLLFKLESIDKP